MKVVPAAGSIWLYWPPPRVCVPGANQNVLPGWFQLTPESSPAATVTAPAGALAGPPPRTDGWPQTRVGAGTLTPLAAGVLVADGVAADRQPTATSRQAAMTATTRQ